jgi:integrase
MYTVNSSYGKAVCALSSLNRLFGSKISLHRSRLALQGWYRRNEQIRKKRPPLTLEVVILIAVTLAKSGYYNAAVATLLGFHCYLRINEMCGLKFEDVIFAGDVRIGSGVQSHVLAALRLKVTKTGRNQTVSIIDSNICSLLKIVCENRNENVSVRSLVFGLNAGQYRRLFQQTCSILGFESISYTPHALRHGGVTFDHMRGIPVKDLMLCGRWKSESALTIYVQTASVLLLDTHITNEQFQSAKIIHENIIRVMNILRKHHL